MTHTSPCVNCAAPETPFNETVSDGDLELKPHAMSGGGAAGQPVTVWYDLLDRGERVGEATLCLAEDDAGARPEGHIGCQIDRRARGRGLADRIAQMLFPVAKRHGLKTVWLTCDPDSQFALDICKRLGGKPADPIAVTEDSPLYVRGIRQRARFSFSL